jgi:hypothetical protein
VDVLPTVTSHRYSEPNDYFPTQFHYFQYILLQTTWLVGRNDVSFFRVTDFLKMQKEHYRHWTRISCIWNTMPFTARNQDNAEVYWRVHKSPPLGPNLSHINPFHIFTLISLYVSWSHLRFGFQICLLFRVLRHNVLRASPKLSPCILSPQ